MNYVDIAIPAGNAINKLFGGAVTLNNPESTAQQQEAAVVTIASGFANAMSAFIQIVNAFSKNPISTSALDTVGSLINGLNLIEKQTLLEQAIASGNNANIVIGPKGSETFGFLN